MEPKWLSSYFVNGLRTVWRHETLSVWNNFPEVVLCEWFRETQGSMESNSKKRESENYLWRPIELFSFHGWLEMMCWWYEDFVMFLIHRLIQLAGCLYLEFFVFFITVRVTIPPRLVLKYGNADKRVNKRTPHEKYIRNEMNTETESMISHIQIRSYDMEKRRSHFNDRR